MIEYKQYRLNNGLRVIVHEDESTPMVSINILYDVGARDEDPNRTGFAHLFEHLMFGGTQQVPDFDAVVTMMGGDSNANTSNDFTQYYLTVPARHLETALWLEADRMRLLDFSQHNLAVQQKVVTEEYNYRYLNQPYGDVWLMLRPLCYKVHPYRWCTIGSDIRHVQEASLRDVEEFFFRYYRPNNAILAVAGNVKFDEVRRLVDKLFGDIEPGAPVVRNLTAEPLPTEVRYLEVERPVPSDALYMAYPTVGRLDDGFCATDLISDILSNGRSSRLYNELVKRQQLFTEVDAYITGERDPGLFVVSGKLRGGVEADTARKAVEEQLRKIADEPLPEAELQKVVNKFEATFYYSHYKPVDRAMSLCYYEWLDRLEWVNSEPQEYRRTSSEDIRSMADRLFQPNHLSMLAVKVKAG